MRPPLIGVSMVVFASGSVFAAPSAPPTVSCEGFLNYVTNHPFSLEVDSNRAALYKTLKAEAIGARSSLPEFDSPSLKSDPNVSQALSTRVQDQQLAPVLNGLPTYDVVNKAKTVRVAASSGVDTNDNHPHFDVYVQYTGSIASADLQNSYGSHMRIGDKRYRMTVFHLDVLGHASPNGNHLCGLTSASVTFNENKPVATSPSEYNVDINQRTCEINRISIAETPTIERSLAFWPCQIMENAPPYSEGKDSVPPTTRTQTAGGGG